MLKTTSPISLTLYISLCEAYDGYPATSLQVATAAHICSEHLWSQKSVSSELLATTGDALRNWEYDGEGPLTSSTSSYVGRQPAISSSHGLTMETGLSRSGVTSGFKTELSDTLHVQMSNSRHDHEFAVTGEWLAIASDKGTESVIKALSAYAK